MQPPAPRPDDPAALPPPPRARAEDPGEHRPEVRRGLVPQPLLDPDAVFVVKRLQRSGHEAYLVGGCVRDLLAGLEPKDFDVATDAHPSRIKRLFHSARIIGRRFRLVHVRFPGDHVIEVSTFRADPMRLALEAEDGGEGEAFDERAERLGVENLFGTAPEDAHRRDFTINALFYDPVEDEVIDWVGGLADLEARIVRSIGEPARRIAEDPVRMIRAAHFAERLQLTLEPALELAIRDQAASIAAASGARLYIELLKLLTRGRARATMQRLLSLGVLRGWIPELAEFLEQAAPWPTQRGGTHEEASQGEPTDLPGGHGTWNLLGAADHFGLAAHGAPESLALTVLLGPYLLTTWKQSGGGGYGAFHDHVERVLRPIALHMSVPRWVQARLRDVLWMLLELREGPRPGRRQRIFFRPGFGEALALLRMDLEARDCPSALADAWAQAADDEGADADLGSTQAARQEALDGMPSTRGRRSRRGGRSRAPDVFGAADERPARQPARGYVPPLPEEADAWDAPALPEAQPEPQPEPTAAPRAAPAAFAPAPARPAAPRVAPPPPVPPVPPVPPARGAARATPAAPTAPPVPRPALADDDFSAGLG